MVGCVMLGLAPPRRAFGCVLFLASERTHRLDADLLFRHIIVVGNNADCRVVIRHVQNAYIEGGAGSARQLVDTNTFTEPN